MSSCFITFFFSIDSQIFRLSILLFLFFFFSHFLHSHINGNSSYLFFLHDSSREKRNDRERGREREIFKDLTTCHFNETNIITFTWHHLSLCKLSLLYLENHIEQHINIVVFIRLRSYLSWIFSRSLITSAIVCVKNRKT
jgi:hypothetical protein